MKPNDTNCPYTFSILPDFAWAFSAQLFHPVLCVSGSSVLIEKVVGSGRIWVVLFWTQSISNVPWKTPIENVPWPIEILFLVLKTIISPETKLVFQCIDINNDYNLEFKSISKY